MDSEKLESIAWRGSARKAKKTGPERSRYGIYSEKPKKRHLSALACSRRSFRWRVCSQIRLHRTFPLTLTGLTAEGDSWCEALNGSIISWPAVREYLRLRHADTLSRFTDLERPNNSRLSDIRYARKAGGFAFEYWCQGGDLQDIGHLLQTFERSLSKFNKPGKISDEQLQVIERLRRSVCNHVANLEEGPPNKDIWKLTLEQREALLQKWQAEISPAGICDRIAEVHLRHQKAISRRHRAREDLEARILSGGEQS